MLNKFDKTRILIDVPTLMKEICGYDGCYTIAKWWLAKYS